MSISRKFPQPTLAAAVAILLVTVDVGNIASLPVVAARSWARKVRRIWRRTSDPTLVPNHWHDASANLIIALGVTLAIIAPSALMPVEYRMEFTALFPLALGNRVHQVLLWRPLSPGLHGGQAEKDTVGEEDEQQDA